jgi:hypothetical protein
MCNKSQLPIYLGRVFITESVVTVARNGLVNILECLERHSARDWGQVSEARKEMNEFALETRGLIVSRYSINTIQIVIVSNEEYSLTKCMVLGEFLEDIDDV